MASPTKEQEYLALALDIERKHGDRGPAYISERLGSAVMQRDADEIAFWQNVARRYQGLLKDKNSEH